MSDNLPEEVMIEILCKLPMKTIIRSTSVCKSWNRLIKSPEFVYAHFRKILLSNRSQNRHFFLHRLSENYGNYKYSIRLDNNKVFNEHLPLQPPFHPNDHIDLVGSCNGVFCFFRDDFSLNRYGYRFVLWNPSIRKSLLLPLPKYIFAANSISFERCKHLVGFGFDSTTHDYKVLRIMNPLMGNDDAFFRTELYSLNSNSWKDITDIAPNYRLDSHRVLVPTFVNDALHWIVNVSSNFVGNLIAVFDFRDEVFRQISLPECLVNSRDLTVEEVFEESTIAVIHQDSNDPKNESHIWVMKEYGVVSSWSKAATVGKRYRGMSKVLALRNNGEVLIEFRRGGLASQNPSTQRLKNLMSYKNGGSRFCRYSLSLALLNGGEDAGNAVYAEGETTFFPRKPKRAKICN